MTAIRGGWWRGHVAAYKHDGAVQHGDWHEQYSMGIGMSSTAWDWYKQYSMGIGISSTGRRAAVFEHDASSRRGQAVQAGVLVGQLPMSVCNTAVHAANKHSSGTG